MALWQNYFQAKTVDEAVNSLPQSEAPSQFIVRGPNLFIDHNQGRVEGDYGGT
jgi:hypothetical protein